MSVLRHDLAVLASASGGDSAWEIIPGLLARKKPVVAVCLDSGPFRLQEHLTTLEADELADALRLSAARARELERAKLAAELAAELADEAAITGADNG